MPGTRASIAILLSAAGAAAIAGALVRMPRASDSDAPPPTPTIEYGRRLLADTSVLLGPDQPDPARRYSGNRLQCASCHLKAGAEPGTLSLLDSFARYPRFSGRDGGLGDLKARINGCMTRSMNGRPLPANGVEMASMAMYLQQLPAESVSQPHPWTIQEPAAFVTPDRKADPAAGERLYTARCVACHRPHGEGVQAAASLSRGYLFPPLWGADSFNDGAGMHRLLTAAKFIKARMPVGRPNLTDEEAFDVAAYINAQSRPAMANLDSDYPDRATKPVDNPYGPFADPFSVDQHRLGPFKPIEQFYAGKKR